MLFLWKIYISFEKSWVLLYFSFTFSFTIFLKSIWYFYISSRGYDSGNLEIGKNMSRLLFCDNYFELNFTLRKRIFLISNSWLILSKLLEAFCLLMRGHKSDSRKRGKCNKCCDICVIVCLKRCKKTYIRKSRTKR